MHILKCCFGKYALFVTRKGCGLFKRRLKKVVFNLFPVYELKESWRENIGTLFNSLLPSINLLSDLGKKFMNYPKK